MFHKLINFQKIMNIKILKKKIYYNKERKRKRKIMKIKI